MSQAVLAALKFYQTGISLIAYDPSIAFTSLVSAIECLAGYEYYERQYEFKNCKSSKRRNRCWSE